MLCNRCKTSALIVGKNLDSSLTTIIGFNHIDLSVKDLNAMVEFYQDAAGYEIMKSKTFQGNSTADKLCERSNMSFISDPQEFGDYKEVFARDIDGNIFSLREPLVKDLKLSISNFKNQ